MRRPSPLWVVSFPRQHILNCMKVERSSSQTSEHVSIHLSFLLTDGVMCPAVSEFLLLQLPAMMDYNLEL